MNQAGKKEPKLIEWDEILLHDLRGRYLRWSGPQGGEEGYGVIAKVEIEEGLVKLHLEQCFCKQSAREPWKPEDSHVTGLQIAEPGEVRLGEIHFLVSLGMQLLRNCYILRPGDNLSPAPERIEETKLVRMPDFSRRI